VIFHGDPTTPTQDLRGRDSVNPPGSTPLVPSAGTDM